MRQLIFVVLITLTHACGSSSSGGSNEVSRQEAADSNVRPNTVTNSSTNSDYEVSSAAESDMIEAAEDIQPPDAPFLVNTLKDSESVTLVWEKPNSHGSEISDYIVEYKPESSGNWQVASSLASSATEKKISGLSPSTTYLFRAYAFNGASGPYSSVLSIKTQDGDSFFDPTNFKLMNVGGAVSSKMVALEDATQVTLADGLSKITLNRGETHSFASTRGDIIESNKPVFIAGNLSVDSAPARSANIVWSSPSWAGHDFIFNLERSKPHLLTVYMFSPGNVSIQFGNEAPQTHAFTANEFKFIGFTQNGNYTIKADSSALIYVHSKGSNNMSYVDPRPILQASYDIIGFPSTAAKVSVDTDSTSITKYVADGTSETEVGFKDVVIEHSGTGVDSNSSSIEFFKAYPTRYISTGGRISAMSFGDGDGTCAASYLPVHLQKKRYAINTSADFVALASTNPSTITITAPDGSTSQVQLTRVGENPNTPYYARLKNQIEGTIYESSQAFAAWYQANTDTDASAGDESLMVGFD